MFIEKKYIIISLFFLFIIILLNKNNIKGGSRIDSMPEGPKKEEAKKREKMVQNNIKKGSNTINKYEEHYKKELEKEKPSYLEIFVNSILDKLEDMNKKINK